MRQNMYILSIVYTTCLFNLDIIFFKFNCFVTGLIFIFHFFLKKCYKYPKKNSIDPNKKVNQEVYIVFFKEHNCNQTAPLLSKLMAWLLHVFNYDN